MIQKYKKLFPDIIKEYKNESNLGIFGNIESTWAKIEGDIIFTCAGDDVLCNGLFEKALELINVNNVDYKNDAFCLFFDFKIVYPSGEEKYFSNHLITKYNPVSLKLRNIIYNRTSCISRKILMQYFPVNKNLGIYADTLLDMQRHIFSQKYYYSPFVGSIYYSGIGISSRTSTGEGARSYIKVLNELESLIPFSKKDRIWIKYKKQRLLFAIEPTIKRLLKTILFYMGSIDLKYLQKIIPEIKDNIFMISQYIKYKTHNI